MKSRAAASLLFGNRQLESSNGECEIVAKPRHGSLTVKHVLIALIIFGVILRMAALAGQDLSWDANYYLTMGNSLVHHGEFWMPWGEHWVEQSNASLRPSFSHHFSPLYPSYLGLLYSLFGYSYVISKIAAFIVSLLTIAVIARTTKNLYGRERGLVVGAIFSLYYVLIIGTAELVSENMTLLFFALTMWAIVKGVKNDRYIALAGLFAGLSYLVRSSLGYFFIIAGVAGFLWRFYYMRWTVFKNKWYLLGITIFLGIVAGWGIRDIIRFGWPNWETSIYIQSTVLAALSQPLQYLETILLLVPFFVFILATFGAFWLPELKNSLHRIKDERISGLWLAVFLVPFIALFISAALSMDEMKQGVPLFWHERTRYLFYAFVPLMWLAVGHTDFHLDDSVASIFKNMRVSFGAIKARVSEILHNRKWLVAILFVSVAAVISRLAMGGWLAIFLLVAALALLFRSPRKRLAVFLALLLVFSIDASTAQVRYAEPKAATDINSMLTAGQSLAVDYTNWHQVYFLSPFIDDPENRIVPYDGHPNATYIASYIPTKTYDNYTPIRFYYDEFESGWIGKTLAVLEGFPSQTRNLILILWRHN
jgi:hypothetical protein